MKWTRDSKDSGAGAAGQADGAGQAGQASQQVMKPTHRAIARHVRGGVTYEMEIGAAWAFATKKATGYTVRLTEPAPVDGFDLLEISPVPRTYNRVSSPSPAGNMPHLRAAVRNDGTGRYDFIGDAWRMLGDDTTVRIHVRLKPDTRATRFALFDAPTWKP